MMAQEKTTVRKWLEQLYLLLTGVYLLLLAFRSTTYYMPFPEVFEKHIFWMLLGTVSAKSFACLLEQKHVRDLLYSVLIGVTYTLVYYSAGYRFFLFLAVLTIGAVGVYYRRLLKLYSVAVGTVLVLAILGSMGGAIENFVYLKSGVLRSSWGICYPTDLASYFVYLSVVLWILGDTVPLWSVLILPSISFIISYFVAGSTTSVYCSIILLLMVLWQLLDDRYSKGRTGWKRAEKLVRSLSIMTFPVCAAFMFLMMRAYWSGAAFAYVADSRMSGRLRLAVNALQNHGIRLLGSTFDQIGGGFSTFINKNYNFIDSSYPLILIRYGALFFLIIMFLWVRLSYQAARSGKQRLMLGMALIAFHSLSEHHFTEVNYNIILLLPFAAMYSDQAAVKGRIEVRSSNSVMEAVVFRFRELWGSSRVCRKGRGAACCAVALFIWLAFPRGLSWMRTICTKAGLSGGGRNGVIVCLILLCLLIVTGFFLFLLLGLFGMWRKGGGWKPSVLALSALCFVMLLGVYVKGDRMIRDAEEQYQKLLDADQSAMETIVAAKTGRVYVDQLPELYRRRFGAISSSVFAGDELARGKHVTAVMARDHDSKCFISRGFLYTEISDYHSVYTNDTAVITRLKQRGYQLRGYYNTERSVDLKSEAEANALTYSEESGLQTRGSAHSLIHGPYLNLLKGKYTVRYMLQMSKDSVSQNMEDTPVAMLRVSNAYGQEVVATKQVYCGDFSADGMLTAELSFSIEESIGVEFLMLTEEGKSVFIREIVYQKTPDYDVHSTYNARHQNIRDEYYDLEGNAAVLPEGYFAVEYEYDSAGNISVLRYYDPENQPVKLSYGYAELHRRYNGKKQVVREEYYDIHSKPTARPTGQAAVEKKYDEKGRVIAEWYYDTEEEPVVLSSGYAAWRRIYNEKDRSVREEYYNAEGRLTALISGLAIIEKSYDEAGNSVVERYYGVDGKPVQVSYGYAELHQMYNEKKQIIREEYYNLEGKPTVLDTGQAAVARSYDEAGNIVVERYYGIDSKPVLLSYGYAELHRMYNEKKQTIREEYYDTEGQLMALKTGQAAVERVYDKAGNVSAERYYDVEGNSVKLSYGLAEVRRSYNEKRQIIREEYYDTAGNPTILKAGQAAVEKDYDVAGNLIVERYYDISGELIATHKR